MRVEVRGVPVQRLQPVAPHSASLSSVVVVVVVEEEVLRCCW
jgi:hypothetical protein